jgi:hypothetical protein
LSTPGDAPNVAARVQGLAEPGSVLITMNVQRQVAGLFVAEEQGARELKGVSEPVQLFRIVRASGGGRRGGARALTPFVGREEELGLLTRRWERARAGEGQLVLIVGEPGLGKSRLVEEFHAQLAETPHTWSEWSASQLLQNTPLHPFAEWGRQRFGGADVPADKRFAELEIALRQVKLDADETTPLLAPLLEIPLPPGRAAAQRQRLTQLQVAYGNALMLRAATGRRKRRKPSQEPASRRPATRTRPNDWRPTTAYGLAALREATCHRCGRTQRPSSATSRRDPSRPRPASPIAPLGSLAGSPASIARRGIASKGRSPCSDPAATTIWPFVSGMTPASPRWRIWRWYRGLSATAVLPEATHVGALSAQLRRPGSRSATAGLRRLRPPLGNGRLPDFHCKSVTIAPLAPYAPKVKSA